MKELRELVEFVREHSPFYRECYRTLPDRVDRIEQLPILDQESFWSANTLVQNRVLTRPLEDGLVLRSGGTSGKPKFSVFSHEEWDAFTRDFAVGLAETGVRDGDRVANLFYVGELYGSFLFTHRVIEVCPVRLLSLPIGGSTAVEEVLKTLVDFEATVFAALPTTIMNFISRLERHPELVSRLQLRLFLFAGEAMYPDQRARIAAILPDAEVRSIGYASNDAGFLGYADRSCGANEFRRHDRSTIYEIVDEESGEPVLEAGRAGRAVVTDLRRRLMPIVRYPVGDRAMWLEPEGTRDRKFRLLGRSDEAARVASLSVYFADIRALLEKYRHELGGFEFQIVTFHENSRDGLTLRLGTRRGAGNPGLEKDIIESLYKERPTIEQFVSLGKILPIRIEWRDATALEINPRTGKLKRIIDLRQADY